MSKLMELVSDLVYHSAVDGEVIASDMQRVRAAVAELERDAARYRWLRMCDWFDGPLCVVRDPKTVFTRGAHLGADCPSRFRLDEAIDAAMEDANG